MGGPRGSMFFGISGRFSGADTGSNFRVSFYIQFNLSCSHRSKINFIQNPPSTDNMLDIFGLEDNLPDELVSSSNSWADQFTPKPPAQGPGPGNLNGEDPGVSSVALQRQQLLQQQQQLQHLMQQVCVFVVVCFPF